GWVAWAGVTALPAASPAFLSSVPDAKARQMLARWQALPSQATDDVGKLAIDALLEASWTRLGNEAERRADDARLQNTPARSQYLPNGVEKQIEMIRQSKPAFMQMVELFGR